MQPPSQDLEVKYWSKDQIVDLSPFPMVTFQAAPVEIHVKEDGATDDTAALIFMIELSSGVVIPVGLTLNMFRDALDKCPKAREIIRQQLFKKS